MADEQDCGKIHVTLYGGPLDGLEVDLPAEAFEGCEARPIGVDLGQGSTVGHRYVVRDGRGEYLPPAPPLRLFDGQAEGDDDA